MKHTVLTSRAAAIQRGAMETETIQKNGASLKSLMSRENFLKKACFTLLAAGVIFLFATACSSTNANSSSTVSSNKNLIGIWQRESGEVWFLEKIVIFFDDGTYGTYRTTPGYEVRGGTYSICDDILKITRTYNSSMGSYSIETYMCKFNINENSLTLVYGKYKPTYKKVKSVEF
jgi:hypothetical protein